MRHVVLVFILFAIIGCNYNKTPRNIETQADKRTRTDTVLIFQGITVGQEYDSVFVDSLQSTFPMKLYNNENKGFPFNQLYVSTQNINGKNVVSYISVSNFIKDPWNTLGLVSMYHDKYGDFSYFTIKKHFTEEILNIRMGCTFAEESRKYMYVDATNAYFKDIKSAKAEDRHSYSWVWEWKNQSIKICQDNIGTSINYDIYGHDTREAAKMLKNNIMTP